VICRTCQCETKVVDCRLNKKGNYIYRRRECINEACGNRFTTTERETHHDASKLVEARLYAVKKKIAEAMHL